MAAEPHERPEFQNAVVYTVAVTVRVRGGARHGTADRRAKALAERLANTAARAKDVVEATAVAGPSHAGKVFWQDPVHFAAANTGRAALPVRGHFQDNLNHSPPRGTVDPGLAAVKVAHVTRMTQAALLRRPTSARPCGNGPRRLLSPWPRDIDPAPTSWVGRLSPRSQPRRAE